MQEVKLTYCKYKGRSAACCLLSKSAVENVEVNLLPRSLRLGEYSRLFGASALLLQTPHGDESFVE